MLHYCGTLGSCGLGAHGSCTTPINAGLHWLFQVHQTFFTVGRGDPCSMFLYAIGTIPMIKSLKSPELIQISLVGSFLV